MTISIIIPVFTGWLAGLIINYLADVLPRTRSFSRPRCDQCEQEFSALEYLLLRACKNGHSRSRRTWATQFISVAASLYIWTIPPEKLGYLLGLILTIYFGVVFVIDLEHRLILHPTSVFGAALGFIVGYLMHGWMPTLLGGLSGLAIMLCFYFLGVLFTRFRARRMRAAGEEPDDEEALGAGDVILVTILGLMVGWPLIWFGLLVGILLGGAVSLLIVLWLVISRQYGKNALMLFIPYGPYFIISAYLILFLPRWLALIVPD
jgi:prepilin signal peptidase PulO-like enzyme (type II secretory pathway)